MPNAFDWKIRVKTACLAGKSQAFFYFLSSLLFSSFFFISYDIINQSEKQSQMEYLRSYNNDINDVLSPLDNPVISAALRLGLILYASYAGPSLPPQLLKFFTYVPFKIFVLFLITYTSNKDAGLAILIAVAYYSSMNVLAGRNAFEAFRQVQYE